VSGRVTVRLFGPALACAAATACVDGRTERQAVCALVDESGTYADEIPEVLRIVRTALLPRMLPGDELIFARIDSKSYERDNVEAVLRLEPRPFAATAQKRAFLETLDAYAEKDHRAAHTDIGGGLLLCAEYLRDVPAKDRTIVVFSDLKEDLPPGVRRVFAEGTFASLRILAMNVKRLEGDNARPEDFRARLGAWAERVGEAGAAEWRVVVAPERLVAHLDAAR
jgi:hypothetical protein